jgi:hypothetical protein
MPRVLSAAIVIGLSVLFLVVAAPPMFGGYASAYTGFHAGDIGTTPDAAHTTVDRGSPAARAGMRNGDIPRCLRWRDYETLFPSFQTPGYGAAPVHACITRNGTLQQVQIVERPGPPAQSLYGPTGFVWLRLLSYCVFLVVGSTLVILRPSLMTWLLFFYCLFTNPNASFTDAFTSVSANAYVEVQTLFELGVYLGAPCLLAFALLVPDPGLPRGWRGWIFWIVCAISLVTAAFNEYDRALFQSTGIFSYPLTHDFNLVMTWAVLIVVLARLLTMPSRERARFGWVAFGIIFGAVANYIRLLAGTASYTNYAGMLTVVMPLTLMYAILRRHVIDVRFAISRTVVYGAITTLVVGIIAIVDWATSVYLSQLRIALAIDALVTIALGIALHRTYGAIENAVDFLVYRRKHDAETYLRRLARTLLRAEREETIDRALVADPYEKLQLETAALFRNADGAYTVAAAAGWDRAGTVSFERDHDIVRFLTTERARLDINDLREHIRAEFREAGTVPVIAVPVLEGDALYGFAIYGLHRDGTKLDPDEVELLETLCQTAAQAYVRIEVLCLRAMVRPIGAAT